MRERELVFRIVLPSLSWKSGLALIAAVAVLGGAAAYATGAWPYVPPTFADRAPLSSSAFTGHFQKLADYLNDLNDRSWSGAVTKRTFDGNVGIGLPDPTAKLHVNDTIQVGVAGGDGFINAPQALYLNIDSDNTDTAQSFVIGKDRTGASGGTNLLTVNENGGVGIATIDPGAYQLRVRGTTNLGTIDVGDGDTRIWGQLTYGGGGPNNAFIVQATAGNTLYLRGGANSSASTTIDPMGNVTVRGSLSTLAGACACGSSRALKERIRDLDAGEAVAAIERLRPMRFVYRRDRSEEKLGFIAEDVPGLVAQNDRRTLDSMEFAALLTKVVQVQQGRIDALERAIAGLRQRARRVH